MFLYLFYFPGPRATSPAAVHRSSAARAGGGGPPPPRGAMSPTGAPSGRNIAGTTTQQARDARLRRNPAAATESRRAAAAVHKQVSRKPGGHPQTTGGKSPPVVQRLDLSTLSSASSAANSRASNPRGPPPAPLHKNLPPHAREFTSLNCFMEISYRGSRVATAPFHLAPVEDGPFLYVCPTPVSMRNAEFSVDGLVGGTATAAKTTGAVIAEPEEELLKGFCVAVLGERAVGGPEESRRLIFQSHATHVQHPSVTAVSAGELYLSHSCWLTGSQEENIVGGARIYLDRVGDNIVGGARIYLDRVGGGSYWMEFVHDVHASSGRLECVRAQSSCISRSPPFCSRKL